jgi:glycosyltransferase involved in cell wall biosynthesis
MSEQRSLKLLVSASAFSPVRGSEFAVGWDYVRAIASRHQVWVIARGTEEEETEEYLRQYPDAMPNVTVYFIPLKGRSFRIFLLDALYYSLIYRRWQWRAYLLARDLDAQIDFDFIHHVTGTGFREPGYLWKLGKPFVWGPIGGLQFFPLNLLNAVPFSSRLFFILSNISAAWAMYLSRRPRRAAAAASVILAGSSNVADKVRTLWGRHATVLCQVSAPDLEPRPPVRRQSGEPLRIVWSGSCEPRKALNIVLLALAKLKGSSFDWQLVVVGDGPLLSDWKTLASKLGLADRCNFVGRVPRAEVLSIMATGHCFVMSSLYEGTPTVVVEALSYGLPVICFDLFGMKDVVNAECGIKIPPYTFDHVIQEFANAIEAIGLDENRRYKMAIAAQSASQRLTVKRKTEVINDVYERILLSPKLSKH